MSKKMMRRSLVLGALMAFVITGQAWAADVVNNATDNNAIAIGASATVVGDSGVAVGRLTNAAGGSVAVGVSSVASGGLSVAMGYGSKAQGDNSVAIGRDNAAGGANSVVMGYDSEALGNYSVAIGSVLSASGERGIAIGSGSSVTGFTGIAIGFETNSAETGSVAIGLRSNATDESTTAMGYGTDATGNRASAYGANAKATGLRSTALGYSAKANNNYDVAVGSHAETKETVNVSSVEIGGKTYEFAGNVATGAVSFGGGGSSSLGVNDIKRQLQNVAAGQVSATSTDAVNGSQLHAAYQAIDKLATDKADKATTLAGYGITDAYTKTETDTAISNAIANNTTVAGKADTTYVDSALEGKADKATTLEGYGITDAYTKAEADEKFLTQEEADARYVKIGSTVEKDDTTGDTTTTTDTVVKQETVAVKDGSTGDVTTTTKTKVTESFVVEHTDDGKGEANTSVTINAGKENQIIIGADGSMRFGLNSSEINSTGVFAGRIDTNNQNHDYDNAQAGINEDGYIKGASGKFEVNGTDGSVKAADGKFKVDAEGNVLAESYNGYKIEELVSQAGDNSAAINGINQRLDRTNAKINKVGAGAAALAALHPLDYDPDDKLTFSAGIGNYAGENAAALGAFYRPNEKFMVSLGGTMGNGENMVNLGLSIGLDKANGFAKMSKRELIQEVNAVKAENEAMKDQLANADERIAKLEALVAQLVKK